MEKLITISSKFVGTSLKSYTKVIDWRDTMNFAAAVNDNNPQYFNDEAEEGVIAPPMYAISITWQILANLPVYLNDSSFPFDIVSTQVHFSEHLQFFKPLKAGDELTVKGVIAAIEQRSAGTHLVVKFEAFNQDGEAVFIEHIGGMMRGIKCLDGSKGVEKLPPMMCIKMPDELLWKKEVFISQSLPYIYDACANVHFPIHTSVKFAHKVGLPSIILHGTATQSIVAKELVNCYAKGDATKLKTIQNLFTGMVFPDTNISIQLIKQKESEDRFEIFFKVFNERQQSVLDNGYAVIEKS